MKTISDLQSLSDSEKLEIMKLDYFQRQGSYAKSSVIKSITDDSVKSQIIHDLPLMEAVFEPYSFRDFLKTVSDEDKIYVVNSPEILKKFNLSKYEITGTISEIENDETKLRVAKDYGLDEYYMVQVIKSCSDEKKKTIVLENKEEFNNIYIEDIIYTFGTETLIDFINNEQDFLESKGMKPFKLIKGMPSKKQLELIDKIDEMNLPEGEKRRIFAGLKNETKKAINIDKIDEKYRKFIEMELSDEYPMSGQIVPNLNGDFSQYQDLDELLSINPLHMIKSDEDRQQLLKLCQICPNAKIIDDMVIGVSTGEEYIKGEQWANSVLEGIQPEWTDVQKLAYIDTMIGKRVSYAPETGTEAEDTDGSRALWKIISKGYGVCNGIAQVEQYLLGRVGIEAEEVSTGKHSFVKVKNIQIPTKNGIVQGDTLVDPTWNLTASRFGAFPRHFCKSYEELRKVDFDDNGIDYQCHKNEELEKATTIDMDETTLREVYKSIGITDKEGNFPIGEYIEQAEQINRTSTDIQSNINRKYALLKKWCPEFATCQNSTIDALRDILFQTDENFDFKRCIASRVYDREDQEKQAVLYVYMDTEDLGKQFFYADKQAGEFMQLSQEEFERKFECYEADMEKLPGHKRPWETAEVIEEKKENSSGNVVAEEGR